MAYTCDEPGCDRYRWGQSTKCFEHHLTPRRGALAQVREELALAQARVAELEAASPGPAQWEVLGFDSSQELPAGWEPFAVCEARTSYPATIVWCRRIRP